MFKTKRQTITLILILLSALMGNACGIAKNTVAANESPATEIASPYSWTRVKERAAYPGGCNYPVFVAQNRMWAFHNEGVWHSADAKNWTKAKLPLVRRNAYEARYVQFNNAVYALGQNQGNYVDGIKFSSIVRRTTDFERWEVLAEKSNLPNRVFYGSVVFNSKIWLLGGCDGKDYYNDVWNSADGVSWTKVSQRAAWSPRNIGITIVFKNRIWMIGGGVIDGEPTNNPKSNDEIWSSADGIDWTLVTDQAHMSALGTPIVFDEKLWLVGANRNGNFARSSLVTNDGVTWREESAPWSPRGAVAAWVFDNKLYITGGKYSVTENGEIKFIYSNDVWSMNTSRT
ncbi:kelch repeat-containing protein [soil metagenome]